MDRYSAQSEYSKMVQERNQPVYNQYDQYLNKTWNDYYTNAKPGTTEYDRYNPLRPQVRPTVVMMPYQDKFGSWQDPWASYSRPGLGFDQWYDTVYNKPDYQTLSGIERTPVEFTGGFNFGPLLNTTNGPVTSIGTGTPPAPLASGLVLHNQGNTN
jgi:hypothetical protein